MKRFVVVFLLLSGSTAIVLGKNPDSIPQSLQRQLMRESLVGLTDVMVYDIFSPPLASRTYTYPWIAFYETMRQKNDGYQSYAMQLEGLAPIPGVEDEEIDLFYAGLWAYFDVAEQLVFSQDLLAEKKKAIFSLLDELQLNSAVVKDSQEYGSQVAQHILTWARNDGYARTRSLPRYMLLRQEGKWKPTPPQYMMPPIEPHWNKLRPFALDSANQFMIPPPPPFSLEKDSEFFQDVQEVYETTQTLTPEKKLIAAFWDCNPFAVEFEGHLAYGLKKISPGAHWMLISDIAISQTNKSPIEAVAIYSYVSMALADAFIASWDEKYRSNLIRPVTVIREHIDPTWEAILQTPPFPEYPSGHSVVSSVAATVLTDIFGSDFRFVDTSEMEYGLPERTFSSFWEAAKEAAISRLYGGIHYMPAITQGIVQGMNVGNWFLKKVSYKPN